MAVYYKFKSAKDYDSIPIDGHFISVLNLKEKIFETKHLGRGTDFDLVVTNAQTNEEYLDEAMLVPKNTSVLIRRVPGRPRMPIVTQEAIQQEPNGEASIPDNAQPTNNNFVGAGSSAMKYTEDSEWDEFGNDLYAIPETLPVHASNPVQDAPPPNKDDEDSKIKALIDTPALDWQRQTDGFGAGRGFGRGMGGRMMGGRGFGRGGFERKTPPPGYVCHRCNQPGHFIQHCPTNGVPEFDVKRVKPPTGIPKSMLMATPEGSYALPSGAVAVLKPNEAAFEREIEGLPSNRPVGDLPPELRCPLCKEVMKDAVLTSKCCFTSFCDRCIRDQFITKSVCVCGANNVLADDLLPNKTVRDTINRILETNNSSTENGGSAFQVQDIESKMEHPRIQQKVPSPTHSAASKGNQTPPPQMENSAMVKETVGQSNSPAAPQNILEMGRMVNVPDVSEATRDLMTVKEHASQGNVPLADDEMQQKPVSGDAGKKKKKKKVRVPPNEMQWRNPQDVAMENYMMPMGPSGYNPYWNGMQPGMEGFLPPFGGPMPPFMGYGHGPLDVPFGLLPQDPFGVPNMMMHHPPFPPQRDLAEIGMGMGMNMGMGMGMRMGMGMNVGPPAMSREEFEARKADLRRKREMERRGERDLSRDREFSREMSSNGDVSSLRPKSRPRPPPSTDNHTTRYCHRSEQPSPPPEHRRHRSEQPSPPADHHRHRSEKQSPPPDRLELPRPSSKRKSSSNYDHHHHRSHRHRSEQPSPPTEHHPPPPSAATVAAATEAEMDRKHKASVFSRISFPTAEEQAAKKKTKKGSFVAEVAPPLPPISSSGHKGNGFYDDDVAVKRAAMESSEEEEEEEDRHFKRRPARYEPSPAPSEEREDGRHSRGRGRERSVRDGRERKHR